MNKLVVALLILFAALTVEAQKVQVRSDQSVDLTKYKTYSWDKGGSMNNPLVHQIIVGAVDRSMAEKGVSKVESAADLTIVAWAATESDLHISHPSWLPSLNSISTGIVGGSQAWPVTKGTLVVDLIDAKTKNSVWRGTGTDTLDQGPTGNLAKDAKGVEKKINKVVTKMFKKFPRSNS